MSLKKEPGGRRVRAGQASPGLAPMAARLLSSGPPGCGPFPSPLRALIGHKCACFMFLVSSNAGCNMGVVTGICNGSNEITHLGRCVVSWSDLNVGVGCICYKSSFLLPWEELRLA